MVRLMVAGSWPARERARGTFVLSYAGGAVIMRTYHKLIAAAAVAATATAVAVVPAIADPPGHKVPRPQDITGVGSDTIQNVFDQFSVDYNHSLKTAAA